MAKMGLGKKIILGLTCAFILVGGAYVAKKALSNNNNSTPPTTDVAKDPSSSTSQNIVILTPEEVKAKNIQTICNNFIDSYEASTGDTVTKINFLDVVGTKLVACVDMDCRYGSGYVNIEIDLGQEITSIEQLAEYDFSSLHFQGNAIYGGSKNDEFANVLLNNDNMCEEIKQYLDNGYEMEILRNNTRNFSHSAILELKTIFNGVVKFTKGEDVVYVSYSMTGYVERCGLEENEYKDAVVDGRITDINFTKEYIYTSSSICEDILEQFNTQTNDNTNSNTQTSDMIN